MSKSTMVEVFFILIERETMVNKVACILCKINMIVAIQSDHNSEAQSLVVKQQLPRGQKRFKTNCTIFYLIANSSSRLI